MTKRFPAFALWRSTARFSREVLTPSTIRAKQILSAFATDTALAHIEIDEKSNEIPAAQKLLEELGVADRIVTLDAMHCQKNVRGRGGCERASDRSAERKPV